MQKLVVLLCSVSEVIVTVHVYDSLCRETLAACYRCNYERGTGDFPQF